MANRNKLSHELATQQNPNADRESTCAHCQQLRGTIARLEREVGQLRAEQERISKHQNATALLSRTENTWAIKFSVARCILIQLLLATSTVCTPFLLKVILEGYETVAGFPAEHIYFTLGSFLLYYPMMVFAAWLIQLILFPMRTSMRWAYLGMQLACFLLFHSASSLANAGDSDELQFFVGITPLLACFAALPTLGWCLFRGKLSVLKSQAKETRLKPQARETGQTTAPHEFDDHDSAFEMAASEDDISRPTAASQNPGLGLQDAFLLTTFVALAMGSLQLLPGSFDTDEIPELLGTLLFYGSLPVLIVGAAMLRLANSFFFQWSNSQAHGLPPDRLRQDNCLSVRSTSWRRLAYTFFVPLLLVTVAMLYFIVFAITEGFTDWGEFASDPEVWVFIIATVFAGCTGFVITMLCSWAAFFLAVRPLSSSVSRLPLSHSKT